MSGKKLISALTAGRAFGSRLRSGANPTLFIADEVRREILERFEEAERTDASSPLWIRERASVTCRAVKVAFDADHAALLERATRLDEKLVRIDIEAFASRREALRARRYEPSHLEADLAALNPIEVDAFVARLFEVDRLPERRTERIAGMVHYVPSSYSVIRAFGSILKPGETFVDVGSGLGLVAVLVAWISGASTRGMEIEPAYFEHAVALAGRLPWLDVRFELGDCRVADYSGARVIYVYDTVRDALLEELLSKVEVDTRKDPTLYVSRGASTERFDRVEWIELVERTREGLSIFKRRT